MYSSPTTRLRTTAWIFTVLLPLAAWYLTSSMWPVMHARAGVFFTIAALLSAALGGIAPALVASLLNCAALAAFVYLHPAPAPHLNNVLWSVLLVAVSLVVGYAREKWSAAEMLAGHLSRDLARLRDELDSQRSDLKRFHELSVNLSSSLERQRLLNDVLNAIAGLQKTDLAMLLLLPKSSSNNLRVEAYAGFSADQIKLFGDLPVSFFSTQRRVLIEDIEAPGAYFPFVDAASQVGIRAVFSVPIINSSGAPLGVVVTFFRNPHSPTERQSRLVQFYIRQAANALDNARLYHTSLETLAAEQHRSAVLRSLADASLQINSVLSLDSLLQVVTDQARKLTGARHAFTTLLPKSDWSQSITCTSSAEGQTPAQFPPEKSEMFMLACGLNKPVRMGAGAEAGHPWKTMMRSGDAVPGGWLAAPLLTRDGRNLGLIQLSGKGAGDFSEDDEAILVHLTHMASVAIDNVRLYREAQEQLAENKRTQDALQRSKESMQLAQRSVGIGMWEWDLQSGALAWSDEICRLHGIEPQQFDRRYETWMESVHPEDRQQLHSSIAEAVASGGEYELQYRVVFADKSLHWLEARGQAVVIGNMAVRMLGVAMDITSRKLGEEALRRSEKLAATGRLAASIAHEINNPLESVTNVLYLLRVTPGLSERVRGHIHTAQMELDRVVHITKQTLAFYREVAAPVRTSIPGLMEDVLMAYSGRITGEHIEIQKRYDDVETIYAYPGELRQVFSNLALNAMEALLPGSGKIGVRVRRAVNAHGQAGIRIVVADNGVGIAQENLSRIFEPFFSTKESKGTGLGLWVSQGIIHKHEGSIMVRSTVNARRHGTCFSIFLPIASHLAGSDHESQKIPHG